MPTFIEEVPELDICVRRPVIAKVVEDLFRQTNIDVNKISIYQMGRTVAIPQIHSTLDESVNKDRLSNETRVEIAMDEEITNVTIAPILYPDNIAIFNDPALQVSLVPTIVPTRTTISVRFVCASRVEAQNWQNAIRRQVSQRQFNPIHTVQFYYPIPLNHMYVLSKIHQMREAQQGYGDSLGEWLKTHFVNRFSVITNSAGKGTQFVIREQQTNIIGYYEFGEEVEKVEKEGEAGSYATEFTYSFFYERPENVVIKFPTVIHNQIVPKEIRDDRQIEDQYPDIYYTSNSGAAFREFSFTQQTNKPYKEFSGLAVPFFDEWYPKYRQKDYQSMLRITSQVLPSDLRWIGNLTDIKPHAFKAHVTAYMKGRPQAMARIRDHLFNVTVHRWDNLFASDELHIDSNFKVTTPVDLNLRDMWHLNIDICTDLRVLSKEALDELCIHYEVLKDWLEIFDPKNPLLNGDWITPPGQWCKNGNWCPWGGYDEHGNRQPGGGWCKDGSYNPGTYDENGYFTPGCVYCKDGSYCPPGSYCKNGNYCPPGGYCQNGDWCPGGYNPNDVLDNLDGINRKPLHLKFVAVYSLIFKHIREQPRR